DSIQFGTYESMLAAAKKRVAELHAQGQTEARLYGANDEDGVGGTGSIFLLLDSPEVYGLPPDPRVPTADLPAMAKTLAKAVGTMGVAVAAAFVMGKGGKKYMAEFDEYRPPGSERRYRGGKKKGKGPRKKRGAGAQDGSREERMAMDFEFSSYY